MTWSRLDAVFMITRDLRVSRASRDGVVRRRCSAVVSLGKDRVQIICEARKNCPDLADACSVARSAVQRAHGISIGKATVVQQRDLIKTSSGKVARRARSRRPVV